MVRRADHPPLPDRVARHQSRRVAMAPIDQPGDGKPIAPVAILRADA